MSIHILQTAWRILIKKSKRPIFLNYAYFLTWSIIWENLFRVFFQIRKILLEIGYYSKIRNDWLNDNYFKFDFASLKNKCFLKINRTRLCISVFIVIMRGNCVFIILYRPQIWNVLHIFTINYISTSMFIWHLCELGHIIICEK